MVNYSDYLITLLCSYKNGETLCLEECDWEELFAMSHAHNLSAIVFSVLNQSSNKSIIPTDVFRKFEDDFMEAVIRYDIQGMKIDEISRILSQSGIRHVFFKGCQLRDLYTVPQARVMSDIDVLIPEDKRDTVKSLLKENGYKCEKQNGPVWDYTKDGVLVEVHTKIVSGKVGSSDAEKCFENAIDNAEYKEYRGVLYNEYNLAYLITHIAHHFWFYGAGVKMILDLAFFINSAEIVFEKVFSILEKVGLSDFAKVILTVCYEWFDTGKDYGVSTEKTKEFLLSYGAFGNANRNNAAVIQRKELEEGKKTGTFISALRLLFPSYEKMKNIPYIRFIEGRRWLVPWAWIYRIFFNLKNRLKAVRKVAQNLGSDETNSDAQSELAYFKEIGLL